MKRGGPLHPKIGDLARRLAIPRYAAVGLAEALWHFAHAYALEGDVGRYSDVEIAERCFWEGEPGKLVEALVGAGLLDRHDCCDRHRLLVHDWEEHADNTTKRAMRRRNLTFAARCADQGRLGFPVEVRPPAEAEADSVQPLSATGGGGGRTVSVQCPTGGAPPARLSGAGSGPELGRQQVAATADSIQPSSDAEVAGGRTVSDTDDGNGRTVSVQCPPGGAPVARLPEPEPEPEAEAGAKALAIAGAGPEPGRSRPGAARQRSPPDGSPGRHAPAQTRAPPGPGSVQFEGQAPDSVSGPDPRAVDRLVLLLMSELNIPPPASLRADSVMAQRTRADITDLTRNVAPALLAGGEKLIDWAMQQAAGCRTARKAIAVFKTRLREHGVLAEKSKCQKVETSK